MSDTVIDNFSKGEFSWREWSAPEFTSAAELREYLDSLNLVGRKIKELKMIGYSYMHTRDWVEESAYCHYKSLLDDKSEIARLSDYDNIDPDLLYDRYAQIDEPLLIRFEDEDRLEIICPVEGKTQVSMNHIPWWIDAGTNLPNEDANILFSDCIGQTIAKVEVYSHKWVTVSESEDGRARSITLVLDEEGDSAYEVILRFENGCGLSLMAECHDYCAVYSINENNKANQLPFRDLKEGLFNQEDLCTDPVTGFEASTWRFHFGKKGQEHTDEPFMTLRPSGVDTKMFVSVDDFLLFDMSIMCIKKDWFDEYGEYVFNYSEWQEVLSTAQSILDYSSFDDLFDHMIGLNIVDRRGNNIPLCMLNTQGASFWNYRDDYIRQLKDMREWTGLTMKENDTMGIYGF